jgi:hypothetical protein
MAKYWKRIVLAGIAAELLYAMYIYWIAPSTQVAYQPIGFATVFAAFVLGGYFAGRGIADASRLLAGVLVGIFGTLSYYVLQIPDILAASKPIPRSPSSTTGSSSPEARLAPCLVDYLRCAKSKLVLRSPAGDARFAA